MRSLAAVVAASCMVWLASVSAAQAETELRNDSFEDGSTVAVQGGFVVGEIAASRFNVPSPVQLIAVRLIFANELTGGASRNVTLRVWADDQSSNAPGVELFSGDFTLMPSQTAMQELSLLTENVTVGGYFRVGIEYQHAGPPSVVNDTNGFSSTAGSLIKESTLGWQRSSLLGVSGDWVLRAVVASGGTPDAGVTPDASTGGPDASTGGPDAGSGGACTGNGDCTIGEYCDPDVRTCTFDCRHDSDCPDDGECNSLGQCIGADGGGGGCCETGNSGGAVGALGLAGLVGLVVTRRRRRA